MNKRTRNPISEKNSQYNCQTCDGNYESYEEWFNHTYRCELSHRLLTAMKKEDSHEKLRTTSSRKSFSNSTSSSRIDQYLVPSGDIPSKKNLRVPPKPSNLDLSLSLKSPGNSIQHSSQPEASPSVARYMKSSSGHVDQKEQLERMLFSSTSSPITSRSSATRHSRRTASTPSVSVSLNTSLNSLRRPSRMNQKHDQSLEESNLSQSLNIFDEVHSPRNASRLKKDLDASNAPNKPSTNAVSIDPRRREKLTYGESKRMVEFDIRDKYYRVLFDQKLTIVTDGNCDLNITSLDATKSNPSSREEIGETAVPETEAKPMSKEDNEIKPYRRYFEKTPEEFQEMVEYDMDDQDMAWLGILNQQRSIKYFINLMKKEPKKAVLLPPFSNTSSNEDWGIAVKSQPNLVTFDLFEAIMDKLEKASRYHIIEMAMDDSLNADSPINLANDSISMNFGKNNESSRMIVSSINIGPETEGICCICLDGDCSNTNMIVFCDICNMAVHQECYGIPYVPEGQWLCRKCYSQPSRNVECALCPNKLGAFKTNSQNMWIHVLCAVWIPEAHFSNPVFMEPIDISSIPPSRYRLKCYICKLARGACIQCSYSKCYSAFHVTCAQNAGLLIRYLEKKKKPVKRYTSDSDVDSSDQEEDESVFSNPDFEFDPATMQEVKRSYCHSHYTKFFESIKAQKNVKILSGSPTPVVREPSSSQKCTKLLKGQKLKSGRSSLSFGNKIKRIYKPREQPTNKRRDSSGRYLPKNSSNSTTDIVMASTEEPQKCIRKRKTCIPVLDDSALPKLIQKFSKHIDFDVEGLIFSIKNYWIIKRYERGGVPFLRRLQASNSNTNTHAISVAVDDVIREVQIKPEMTERHKQKIYANIFQENKKAFVFVRENVEKLRLLVELIRLREKAKLEQLSIWEDNLKAKYFSDHYSIVSALKSIITVIKSVDDPITSNGSASLGTSKNEKIEANLLQSIQRIFGVSTENPTNLEMREILRILHDLKVNATNGNYENFAEVRDAFMSMVRKSLLDLSTIKDTSLMDCEIDVFGDSSNGSAKNLYDLSKSFTLYLKLYGNVDDVPVVPEFESLPHVNCTTTLEKLNNRKISAVDRKLSLFSRYLKYIPCDSFRVNLLSKSLNSSHLDNSLLETSKKDSSSTEKSKILLDPKVYPVSFPEFSIVWAKVAGYPFYPAIVIHPRRIVKKLNHEKFFIPVDDIQIPLPKITPNIQQFYDEMPRPKTAGNNKKVDASGGGCSNTEGHCMVVFLDRLFTWNIIPRHGLNLLGSDREVDLYHILTVLSNKKYAGTFFKCFSRAYRRAIRLLHKMRILTSTTSKNHSDAEGSSITDGIEEDLTEKCNITEEDWSSEDEVAQIRESNMNKSEDSVTECIESVPSFNSSNKMLVVKKNKSCLTETNKSDKINSPVTRSFRRSMSNVHEDLNCDESLNSVKRLRSNLT